MAAAQRAGLCLRCFHAHVRMRKEFFFTIFLRFDAEYLFWPSLLFAFGVMMPVYFNQCAPDMYIRMVISESQMVLLPWDADGSKTPLGCAPQSFQLKNGPTANPVHAPYRTPASNEKVKLSLKPRVLGRML